MQLNPKIIEKRQQLADRQKEVNNKLLEADGVDAINRTLVGIAKVQAAHRAEHEPNVSVKNFPKSATPEDIKKLANDLSKSLDKLNKTTDSSTKKLIQEMSKSMREVSTKSDVEKIDFRPLIDAVKKSQPKSVEVSNITALTKKMDAVLKAIKDLKLDPKINVDAPKVEVSTPEVDITQVSRAIESLKADLKAIKDKKQPELDLTPLEKSTQQTTEAIQALRFPVPNFELPFVDSSGKAARVVLDSSGNIPVSSGSSGGAAKATDAYAWQATSDDGTYKYFYFEDASANYYIMRKHKTNKVATYTKGTGGYASVYVSASAGPSGSPTWASYGTTF